MAFSVGPLFRPSDTFIPVVLVQIFSWYSILQAYYSLILVNPPEIATFRVHDSLGIVYFVNGIRLTETANFDPPIFWLQKGGSWVIYKNRVTNNRNIIMWIVHFEFFYLVGFISSHLSALYIFGIPALLYIYFLNEEVQIGKIKKKISRARISKFFLLWFTLGFTLFFYVPLGGWEGPLNW